MKKAHLDQQNLIKAKDALNLDVGEINSDISNCLVELSELTEVRQAISKPWEALARLKETLWSGVAMRIREALDDLLIDMRSLPKRTLQYDASMTQSNCI